MQRFMLHAKIHRATVTQADLHHVGSLTIDRDVPDGFGLGTSAVRKHPELHH